MAEYIKEIVVSIVTIGDELLIGQTVDTNSSWMAKALTQNGFSVKKRIAVRDDAADIKNVLEQERGVSDVVLMTGGLGPTDDDKTKGVLADYFKTTLVMNADVLERVKKRIARFDTVFLERNKNQALVPQKADVLLNALGTAPGLWFEEDETVFVALPGIPFEMKGLMTKEVIPRLLTRFETPVILHRHWMVSGVPESTLAEELLSYERSLPEHITLAYLPGNGFLRLRLTAHGSMAQKLAHELDQYDSSLEQKIKPYMKVKGDVPIAEHVGKQLRERGVSLATAESCTGGYIGHLITSIPGSSAYFEGAVVTYNNAIKRRLLGVPNGVLVEKGAVSEEVVSAMLKGLIESLGTDIGIAVSGIMGPGGGSPDKPVGTVWLAAGGKKNILTKKLQLRYDRAKNIRCAGNEALILLLDALKIIGK